MRNVLANDAGYPLRAHCGSRSIGRAVSWAQPRGDMRAARTPAASSRPSHAKRLRQCALRSV
ncbi:hypothetical protein WS76_09005 [Burkholderia humptydooensis]|nr:hypothetical protein WS76_09005 [Burkholderia humptydooensis]